MYGCPQGTQRTPNEAAHAMTITYEATEFDTASEAIQHTDASGRGIAITVRGQAMVVEQSDAHRLEAAGVEFAYLHDHEMPDGSYRIMTVPVN
jgi:hypothetical protein